MYPTVDVIFCSGTNYHTQRNALSYENELPPPSVQMPSAGSKNPKLVKSLLIHSQNAHISRAVIVVWFYITQDANQMALACGEKSQLQCSNTLRVCVLRA